MSDRSEFVELVESVEFVGFAVRSSRWTAAELDPLDLASGFAAAWCNLALWSAPAPLRGWAIAPVPTILDGQAAGFP